jgi:hypothetical protein
VLSGGISRQELDVEGAAAVFDNTRQLVAQIGKTPIAALAATTR